MQSEIRRRLIVVPVQDWRGVDRVGQPAQSLLKVLCTIVDIIVVQFELADKMDFLFHEFCLDLIS